ncbi:hypothetical protein DESC_350007 [Desulfosarcina cetonica]|nr:hypothetical protein DESC_350007 [Desulfosarcina cetonica]
MPMASRSPPIQALHFFDKQMMMPGRENFIQAECLTRWMKAISFSDHCCYEDGLLGSF